MLAGFSVLLPLLATTAVAQFLSPFPDGYFYIRNNASGTVLDVYENSKKDDASVVGYELKKTGPDNQLWKYEAPGFLVNKNSELLLEVFVLDTPIPGRPLIQAPKLTMVNQLWTYDSSTKQLRLSGDPTICVIISKDQFTDRKPILPKAMTALCIPRNEDQKWDFVKA
ncbi:hypothetical protein P691DRAFT_763999 [Macrolepiota fuliginosa MF-IS2]|uniref:Ricin B lectin domain-containing protein n=1 Tax=Macrolepiota fuliginosa MF-IS2 TaxID=1400762 RepID=A0A9P5X3I4_9AGAR|nr:hypothetical protein P691DRAFT_763999 [Macrolepiota fuliginosa MF-IS2]